MPAGYTGEQLTGNMSAALNSTGEISSLAAKSSCTHHPRHPTSFFALTGRDIWLNFHCWNTTTCATYGNSYRIAPDHHDDWDSTSSMLAFSTC